MDGNHSQEKPIYHIYPIGYARGSDAEGFRLEILEPFRPALRHLGQFSHVIVLWWADQFDDEMYRNILQAEPPYAPSVTTGIFATRAPCRPNPVAMTTCDILDVDEENGIVRVAYFDAFDGTPIIDLKAYFPVSDRVKEACIPAWLSGWPEWIDNEWEPEGMEQLGH